LDPEQQRQHAPPPVTGCNGVTMSHPSRGKDGGCSQDDLKSTGGNGLLYCFAIN